MNCKKCTQCNRKSYSATFYGKWLCPYCGHDLSQIHGCPAGIGSEGEKLALPSVSAMFINQDLTSKEVKSRGKVIYLMGRQR